MEEETKLEVLPEDCIVGVLRLTSPLDVCKTAVVCAAVHAAAESDLLWENFLPPDYREVLSRLVSPVACRSKKELFLRLCIPLLIDGGRMSFSLERSTSKKCYMLSARELSITWSANSLYWCWKPFPRSRFGEAVELITISWLEIQGKMNARFLSPSTTYAAYLVVDIADRAYGLDLLPSEVCVGVGNYQSRGSVYLRREGRSREAVERVWMGNRAAGQRLRAAKGEERVLRAREDGWLEMELGEFYSHGRDEEVNMSLREVKGVHLKGGLLVEGIELRPKS